jgi:CubicO group peptidase (beta-lactamase class C family)
MRVSAEGASPAGRPACAAQHAVESCGATGAHLVTLLAALLAACSGAGESEPGGAVPVELASEALAEAPATSSVGLDSARIAAAVARAESLPRLRTLLIARHGDLLVEQRFRGPGLEAAANVKSVSKSVLSALVGIAIAEGHLQGVDQPIGPFFERYLGPAEDPRKRAITIGQLLSMQSGLERTSGGNYGRWVGSRNWVRHALTRPLVADPGGAMLYSTGNSHLVSAILTQASGQSTWAYARDWLSQPLGFTLPRWPADPQGIYFGGNEMRLTPRAMLRFGELYRNGGRHGGRQVIPEAWIRESLTPRTRSPWSGELYGYGWFLAEVRGYPMFYAWGYGGQFIFVVPDLELTVVTTSDPDAPREGQHLRAVRELLADWIVPAAEAGITGRRA